MKMNRLGFAAILVLTSALGGCGRNETEPTQRTGSTTEVVKTEVVQDNASTPEASWDVILTEGWGLSPRYLGTPSWSPDSSRLVIDAEHMYGPVAIVSLDGSPPTSLFSEWCGSFGWPTCSPQGDEIAFVYNHPAYCEPTLDRNGLYITDLSHANVPSRARLVREFPPGQKIYGPLSWSPDAQEIFFGVYDEDYHSVIRRIRTDGTGEEEIVSIASTSSFELSPDGEQIVFGKGGWGFQQLWIFDLATGREWRLEYDPFRLGSGGLTWSPDGQRIAFSTRSESVGGKTYVINTDGSGLQLVDESGLGSIAWSPDGRWLAGVVSYFEAESGSWFTLVLKEVDF